jgi:hypothetical protein
VQTKAVQQSHDTVASLLTQLSLTLDKPRGARTRRDNKPTNFSNTTPASSSGAPAMSRANLPIRCFNCNQLGHRRVDCTRAVKREREVSPAAEKIPRKTIDVSLCTYCKRSGHDIENCFTRKRNETRSKLNQRSS